MTLEQFKEKYVNKAVYCDTEEKAKELLVLAHGFGWKWSDGDNLTKRTYWCFRQEKTCYMLSDYKTVLLAPYGFYKEGGCEIVKFESDEKKVKKTKKVFDLGLFVDDMKKNEFLDMQIMFRIKRWALECHGLTKEEMIEKNYYFAPLWMKEVEVEVELTEHEIEVLKELKVLGFKWIARDRDDSLYAYDSNPIKINALYFTLCHSSYLNKDLFKFVTWEDGEPVVIDELLG